MSIVQRLAPADRDKIVEVLASSFHSYPVFRYVLKDASSEESYGRQLRLLIGFFVDARLMRDWPVFGIQNDDQLVAAMLLSDPVFKPRPDALNAVYEEVAAEIGDRALSRLEEFESASADYEPKARTYFVGMVGVDPSYQRMGYGRHLMNHVESLSLSRPESDGVTLTTEAPENIAFYEALGYRMLGSTQIGELTSWFFYLEH